MVNELLNYLVNEKYALESKIKISRDKPGQTSFLLTVLIYANEENTAFIHCVSG